ncbi:unnamed protein product [marine sediment metagenome]|uniref:Uncharacterized protein n=1 Tax=marine sediment metagenome TaxID=412755 RepID=X1ND37_9ZZZZ
MKTDYRKFKHIRILGFGEGTRGAVEDTIKEVKKQRPGEKIEFLQIPIEAFEEEAKGGSKKTK